MKLFVVSFMFAIVAAESLDNTYLPPNNAKSSGGSDDLLTAPNVQNLNSQFGPADLSTKYLPSNRKANEPNSNGQSSQNPDGNAATLRFDNENNGDGSYNFQFETENKIKHEEIGELKNVGTEQEVTVVQGSYSYLGPDGIQYTVTYVADENGFQASGDHLPTSPPVPEEIQRSLEKAAAEENQQGYTSGPSNGYQARQTTGYQNDQISVQNDKESITVESPEFNRNIQNLSTNQSQGIPQVSDEKYLPPQAPGRQYLTPNNPEPNAKTGYKY